MNEWFKFENENLEMYLLSIKSFESQRKKRIFSEKTYLLRPTNTQISLRMRAVRLESPLSTRRNFAFLSI